MLDNKTTAKARELLGDLDRPVRLIAFTQEFECDYCRDTIELLGDVAGLSDRVSLEVYDFQKDAATSGQYGIDKIPALAVVGEKDHGIRFFGIPSGYEFVSLLDAISTVSTGNHQLAPETVEVVSRLKKPVHLQVFVTPTCPYCPRSVILAHKLAFVSDQVRGDMVEAMEFPHLAQKYGVMGVPRSVINEEHAVEGALPEAAFVKQVIAAVG